MKKRILFTFFSFLLLTSIYAQEWKTVADKTAFMNRYATESAKINTIKSDLIQQKKLKSLKDPVVLKGFFYYKKENNIRMEYPSQNYAMIIKKEEIYIKEEKTGDKFKKVSNKTTHQINNLISRWMQGKGMDGTEFQAAVFENDKQFLLKLSPVVSSYKKMFTEVKIYVDKASYTADKVEMADKRGNNISYTYTNKVFNEPLKESLFKEN